MSVSLAYAMTLTASETLETNVPAGSAKVITHAAFNKSGTLNATTTIPVTKPAYRDIAMTAGAVTIDLSALIGTNGATVVGTGLKPQFVYFENAVAAQSPITIVPGAANGHNFLGTGCSITLKVGQWVLMGLADQADDVAAADKTWDVTGTGAEILRTAIILG